MNIWGRVKQNNSTVDDAVITISEKTAHNVKDWGEPMAELCRLLNLSRPVILKKHIREFEEFSLAVFRPADFLEPVSFDRFEVELY